MVDTMYTNSRSSLRYNANHPELKPGESFQTNISLKLLHEKDLTNCNDLSFTVESGGKIEIYLYTDLKVTITQEMVSIPSIALHKITHLIKYIQIGHKEKLCQTQ